MEVPRTPDALRALQNALKGRIAGDLRLDAMTRGLYATDGSMYQKMPLGVLLPKHTDDVQAAVEAAHRLGIPVLPRGGGSSLAGQTVNAALVIDFSRHLGGVIEINAEQKRARVQPGLVLDHLTKRIAPLGLMVGPDPASSSRATLGGMVGNNATGTHSIVYGNTIHHIREVKALLADGSAATFGPTSADVWRQKLALSGREGDLYRGLDALLAAEADTIRRDTARHWRRNSGYRIEHLLEENFADGERNVARLLCGSEGTLAVTTEIEIALVDKPVRTALGVAHFTSLDAALRATPAMLETGPSAVELFDDYAVRAAKAAPGFASKMGFVAGDPGAILITEYFGESDAELRDKVDKLERVLESTAHGYYALVRAFEPAEIHAIWAVRKEGLGIIMSARGDLRPIAFIEDASVPPEHLADYIERLLSMLKETNTPVALYAHASAGTLHVRPFINTKDANDVEKMARIAVASMELVRGYGGTVSSEHADGRARSWLNPGLLGEELYRANVEVKRLFDPDNRLNPGNVVDAPPMTIDLRLGPDYHALPILTEYDWSTEGTFALAVEQCNGNGACRKLESGVMCPSYMVTLEEEHTTRGRANALRMAMSGALGPDALLGERMEEVMDLCVMCKGCKTECPSNVDLSKMKGEWLQTVHDAKGVSARTRFFAEAPRVARLLHRLGRGPGAALVNRANRVGFFRKGLERALGITTKRALPAYAREPFTEWFKQQTWTGQGAEVVLFADTFSNYNHPEIAKAAARFLDRAGYRVLVTAPEACCGRPALSKGLIREAKAQAARALDLLAEHAEAGRPVIGLEPSCLLTFRDEFVSLLPGDARVAKLAACAFLFEDFVAREAAAGRLDHLGWKPGGGRVLLHGHCHQKAIAGTAGALAALALPGYEVELIDSSCCGMAGSFGYEVEHYDVSVKMAERRLMPAVRAAAPGTLIAAAGTSCRAQITDLSDRHPLHPAQILLDALA